MAAMNEILAKLEDQEATAGPHSFGVQLIAVLLPRGIRNSLTYEVPNRDRQYDRAHSHAPQQINKGSRFIFAQKEAGAYTPLVGVKILGKNLPQS